jgi:hypothetical protein
MSAHTVSMFPAPTDWNPEMTEPENKILWSGAFLDGHLTIVDSNDGVDKIYYYYFKSFDSIVDGHMNVLPEDTAAEVVTKMLHAIRELYLRTTIADRNKLILNGYIRLQ